MGTVLSSECSLSMSVTVEVPSYVCLSNFSFPVRRFSPSAIFVVTVLGVCFRCIYGIGGGGGGVRIGHSVFRVSVRF